jgi:hypothetical protein
MGLVIPPGDLLAAAQQAARQVAQGGDWQVLLPEEAAELEAVADQIWPRDDTPGAGELGAVVFMDAALGGFMADALPLVQAGLKDLAARATAVNPVAAKFSQLPAAQQTGILVAVERTPFFATVHSLALLGLFALPAYGGNRDRGGWAQLGFESRHVWRPPFGYYDAGYTDAHDERG